MFMICGSGRNIMKKIISVIIAAAMAVSICACGSAAKSAAATAEGKGISIVTTIFPEYDWVMDVLGDNPANAEVTMLLDNGVDLHSYQPSAQDIVKISDCDLFIYVGGESDEWVNDALKEATNKDMTVINLLDVLGTNVKEEEVVEGMQAEEEEEHEGEDGEEVEYDEHVWLSLRNASTIVKSISEAIVKIDPDNKETYEKNTADYVDKLNALDKEYDTMVSGASIKTVLFGDRFPFRYLVDDYALSYYAAFVGCSAETEASFETITFLAKKVDELGLPAVMTIEGKDHRIAETIVENTASKDAKILIMDSMQATTAEDVKNGKTYLNIMKDNLDVLTQALK